MNDLTKDELSILLLEMNIVIQRTTRQGILKVSPIYFELRDKIQSLIDNYCEHEKIDYVGDINGYYCQKCDKQFDYEYIGDERHERIVNGDE